MKLAIELNPEQRRQLEAAAARLSIPVETLAAAAIRDLVALPSPDFDEVATKLLERNRELYKRLS